MTSCSSGAYLRLLATMTWSEFKLKDQGTVVGFLWTLLHPALMFVILYLLFTRWLGPHVDNYPAYLIIGLVNWQFFEKATTHALPSLKRKSALLRNFRFPRELIILSAVGSVALAYALELAVLLVFLGAVGVPPSGRWLLLPLPLALTLAVTLGVSVTLSVLALVYDDMERIWSILVTCVFFTTPVFYPLSILTPSHRELVALNPMLHVVDAFRCVLLGTPLASPAAAAAILAAGLALSAVSLAWFRRSSLRLMDRIISP